MDSALRPATTLARLSRLTGSDKPLIVLTTVNAIVQRVPAREVVAAHIARIEAFDPAINAIITRTFETAITKAAEADPDNADTLFNLGYAYAVDRDPQQPQWRKPDGRRCNSRR